MIKILWVLCLLLLNGCTGMKEDKSKQYVTLTFTHVTDQEDQYEMNTYMYDLNKEELTLVSQLPYHAQYPLTFYDRSRDTVYYTNRIDGNDEVFAYNCQTKKSVQLTNGLFAVNAILKMNDHELAFIGAGEEVNVCLWIYDLDTNQLKLIDMDDFSISAQSFVNDEHSLIFTGYSSDEEWKLRDAYNSDKIDSYELPYTFYSYNAKTGRLEELFTETAGDVTTMAADDHYIYYKVKNMFTADSKIVRYDRQAKTKEIVDDMDNVYGFIGIDDQEDIIYIGNKSKGNSFLKKMNLKNHKEESLFTHENIEGQINNGFIVE